MAELINTYPWILPLAIFLGRICDVTLGTMRIIFVSKGEKRIAPFIGFMEVFIWIVIIAQVLSHADNLISYLAYAGGYATGTFLGLLIEERIAFGYVKYRVFTAGNGFKLVGAFNEANLGATLVHGEGSVSEIDIVEVAISRKNAKAVEKIINDFDPKAFFLIEDVRARQQGIFAKRQTLLTRK